MQLKLSKFMPRGLVLLATTVLTVSVGMPHAQARNNANRGKGASTLVISQSNDLWWFNGQRPVNYQYTATLTVTGVDPTSRAAWQLIAGSNKVALRQNPNTNNQSIYIDSIGYSAPATRVTKDITIKVTVTSADGQTTKSGTFKTVVFTPYYARQYSVVDSDWDHGFTSLISYHIRNQFNRSLPNGALVNEHFTSPIVNDYPIPTDWTRNDVGIPVPNSAFADKIGQRATDVTPLPVHPTSSQAGVKVDHWTGTWNVGSTNPGDGQPLRSTAWSGTTYCIWQRYRGKGRHR